MRTTWQKKPLGECAKFLSGGTPSKARAEFWEGEIPWASSGELTEPRLNDTAPHVTPEAVEYGSRMIPEDTILAVVRGMSLAKEFRISLTTREMSFNQDLKALVAKPGIDPVFLFYALFARREYIRDRATEAAHGTKKLETDVLSGVELSIPEHETQTRVAAIARSYDDLIEYNRRRIALLEESARLLYREWFVHLRFPGHKHTRIVNGVPEGWEQKTLGDALTLKRGYDLPASSRIDGSIPIVSSSGITGYHGEKKCDPPGIVTGRYGTLGQVYFIQEPFWPLNTALYVSDFKGTPAAYATLLLEFSLQGTQSDKAAIPGLNRNVVHCLPILWPPKHLREEFNELARLSSEQSRILTLQNQKLRTARDLLLPKLMSGGLEV